jgi:hypothetical protein
MRFNLGMALALSAAACSQVNVGPGSTASVQAASGSATLSWTPVTQNTDGTLLTDLAGYHVHYGTSATVMGTVVVLAEPNQTSYVVTALSSGTWYFAVAAYTTSGVEGELSNVATKTIAIAAQ